MIGRLRDWARRIKRDVIILWLAARDPRTPLQVKLLAGAVAAYALSPLDLIPDFVPVLGYLDDLLIVPAGVWLALRLIPPELKEDLRAQALALESRPTSWAAAGVIVLIWTLAGLAGALLLWRILGGRLG